MTATLGDLALYLVGACLRPTEGERVLVRWYPGQGGLFEGLAAALAEAGAVVTAVERGADWLSACSAAELGDDWLPPPSAPYDRVVTASPPADVDRPDGVSEQVWNEGHRHGYGNLGLRVTAAAPTALLDWPLHARGGLSRGQVRRLYAQAMAIDYDALARRNAELVRRMEQPGPGPVRVRCPRGTDLVLSVEGRPWRLESCNHTDGPVVYLPGGEIYSACVETSAEGVIVFNDGRRYGRATVSAGRILRIEDSDWAGDLDGLSVGELGLGTNPRAPYQQLGTVTEKAIGTAHIGVGANFFLGGEVSDEHTHIDLVIDEPQVSVAGVPVDITGLPA